MTTRIGQWRAAWICLTLAIALHVTDEALTGFLPVYNGVVEAFRAKYPWIPLPIFTFRVWLGGLILGILLLIALTPLVSRGKNWLRVASMILSVLMIGNAMGHFGASVYWRRLAPGVYSAPVLLVTALALLITAFRARVRETHVGT